MTATAELPLDVLDPMLFENGYPHELWRRLRAESPLHFFPKGPIPYWAATRHRDITTISRNPELFTSELTLGVSEIGPDTLSRPKSMIEMDPPRHRVFRRMISDRFTPRAVEKMRAHVDDIVREIVRDLVAEGDGECDFVERVAARIPVAMIGSLLGVPERDWNRISEFANISLTLGDPKVALEDPLQLFDEQDRYFTQLAEDRRKHPTNDLMTLFTQVEENGKKLTQSDILGWAELFLVGGSETTRNAMSGGLLALIENPGELVRLQRDPSLLTSAVEEVLRWTSPAIHFARTATADTELRGQRIRKGDVVALVYASANRDEDLFDEPDRFRIDRSPNRHLAFGVGEHLCPGAHVARLELQMLFEHLLPRLAEVELAGPVERLRANVVGGISRLPIRYRLKDA